MKTAEELQKEFEDFHEAWYYELNPTMQSLFREQLNELLSLAETYTEQMANKAFHKGIAHEKGLDVYWDVSTQGIFEIYWKQFIN